MQTIFYTIYFYIFIKKLYFLIKILYNSVTIIGDKKMRKTIKIMTLISTLILTSCGSGGGGGGTEPTGPNSPVTFDGTLHTFGNVSNQSGICVSGNRGSYSKQDLVYDFDQLCADVGGTVSNINPGGNPPDTCSLSTGLDLTCTAAGGDCSGLAHQNSCADAGGVYNDNSGNANPPVKTCSVTVNTEDKCKASGGKYLPNTGILYSIQSNLTQNFSFGNNSVLFQDLNTNIYQFGTYQDGFGVTQIDYYNDGIHHPLSLTLSLRVGTDWTATVERATSNSFSSNVSNNEQLHSFSVNIPFSYNAHVQVDSATLLFESN